MTEQQIKRLMGESSLTLFWDTEFCRAVNRAVIAHELKGEVLAKAWDLLHLYGGTFAD